MLALLVDDDQESRETMGMILEMDGFNVCYAANGRQALERLTQPSQESPFVDLIVLDLDMPETTGLELLQALEPQARMIPIMVVTGYASKSTIIKLMRFGVKDFLDKPIQMDEFRSRIRQMKQVSSKVGNDTELVTSDAIKIKGNTESPLEPSMIDIADLAFPNAYKCKHSPPIGRDLAISCIKDHGYDILLATTNATGIEGFSQIMQIKGFAEQYRDLSASATTCIKALNKTLIESELTNSATQVTFMRILKAQKRLEIYNAGGSAITYLDSLGKPSQPQFAFGTDLGLIDEIRIEKIAFTYIPGDRVYLHSPGFNQIAMRKSLVPRTMNSGLGLNGFLPLFIHHNDLSLEQSVELLWNAVLENHQEGDSNDLFLWGIELV